MGSLLARARGITVTDDADARQDAAKPETARLANKQGEIVRRVLFADIVIIVAVWGVLIGTDFFFTGAGSSEWRYIPIQFIAGAGLILMAVVTFFGLYLASVAGGADFGHSMRNAITAAFVVLYLVMLPVMLLSPKLFQSTFGPTSTGTLNADQLEAITDDVEFGRDTFSGFTNFITIVLGFYFASQVTEQVSKNRERGETERTEIESLAQIEMLHMQQSAPGRQPEPENDGGSK